MCEIRIDIDGLDDDERKLLRLGALLSDLRPFWPRIVPLFVSWVGKQFDSEGAFFGGRWVALSPEYAAWKATHFPGKKILSRGGHSGQTLRGAATSPKRIVTPLMMTLTIEPYENDGRTIEPSWFQEGTLDAGGTMPARPLLSEELPAGALVEVEAAGQAYARELVARLGL